MKKTILISLIAGITLMFGSWAMATSTPTLPAPTGLTCIPDGDSVPFDWDDVIGAKKYSVDVEVLIDGIWDEGIIVKLSFGTSDRTDGGLMGDSDLDVLFTDFVYDIDNDPLTPPDQLSGEARAKVKALNPPGKSQNNPFTDWCYFTIP
ncbi:MAG: hypothetical protein A2156_12720 [Deltaproteobacteria bacterium RBG_16_48_10]|nr:MAG: hypothetical protein A2156_12720 [Deltaproteobacteria bacterium RBG_16_48_10]